MKIPTFRGQAEDIVNFVNEVMMLPVKSHDHRYEMATQGVYEMLIASHPSAKLTIKDK